MVYSLDEYLKMNAEIIELNQESNKIHFLIFFFFFYTCPDNILNEIKYRSHPAWTFGLHSAK